MIKVIIAHPSRQHSYKTAEALKQSGLLYKYITRVYNTPNSIWLRMAKKICKGDLLKRIENRRSEALDDSVLLMDEILGYIQQLLGRLDKKKHFYFSFFNWSAKHFEIKVAKYAIKENVDAIIFYDTAAYWGMKYIKDHHSKIKCILDNSSVPANFRNKILLDNKKLCGEYWKTLEHLEIPTDVNPKRRETQEILMADYHLTASSFSKSGLLYNGIQSGKVSVIPYGVDKKFFGKKEVVDNEFLNCLFVGHINQLKGIAQILDCAIRFTEKKIRFVLVGSGRETHPDLFPEMENVIYKGTLFGEELKLAYLNADIFLFPTMGDGFGLVILEAMAAGLPVVATFNCGAPDIIINGQNGLLMENCSADCLAEKIMWFYRHKESLPYMSVQAIETAKKYSWDRYYSEIGKVVNDVIMEST